MELFSKLNIFITWQNSDLKFMSPARLQDKGLDFFLKIIFDCLVTDTRARYLYFLTGYDKKAK